MLGQPSLTITQGSESYEMWCAAVVIGKLIEEKGRASHCGSHESGVASPRLCQTGVRVCD